MDFKKIFSLILITVFVCVFSGLTFAKTYVVGTSAGFPPFEYVNENGNIVGFDIDLVKAIGKLKGFDVKVKDISFDSLPAALKTGNIDMIVAGMTITEEREKVLDFSQPYWTANQSIIVNEDSKEGLTVLFGDNDIGVQTGTTGDIWVTDNFKEKGILTGKVAHYDTCVLVVSDLINGNLDGIVLDTPVAKSYTAQKPIKVVAEIVTGEEYGIAIDEGNTELLNLINEGIDELKVNGKIDELITKYFK